MWGQPPSAVRGAQLRKVLRAVNREIPRSTLCSSVPPVFKALALPIS
jgi:hypothetical protein